MLQELRDRGIYLTEDEYRTGLRALFPEDYQGLSDSELEDIIYDRIASLSPSEAESLIEGFGSWLKKAVHSAAPIFTAALPAVATVAGTAFGGPLGGAIGGMAGNLASKAISGATHTRPNQLVSNIGSVATAVASGNPRAAIPGALNVTRSIGNAVSRGAGNRIAGAAGAVLQTATAAAAGGAGGGNPLAGIAAAVGGGGSNNPLAGIASAVGGGGGNSTQAATQLLSFLNSTPLLQSLLSSIATGSIGTSLQIPREDGSTTSTSYVEMLESLRHLTENALIEADTQGYAFSLPLESESDQEDYIESLIEDVGNYENALLPNYDAVTY